MQLLLLVFPLGRRGITEHGFVDGGVGGIQGHAPVIGGGRWWRWRIAERARLVFAESASLKGRVRHGVTKRSDDRHALECSEWILDVTPS